jgi:hypothetical protein
MDVKKFLKLSFTLEESDNMVNFNKLNPLNFLNVLCVWSVRVLYSAFSVVSFIFMGPVNSRNCHGKP